jgi:hypothetical protein
VPSIVEIVNRALVSVGALPIVTLGVGGKASTTAAVLWPQVRDHVLGSHPWNCATKRVVLAPLVDAPVFEWGYQYELPGDWLRTVEINARKWPTDGWVREGRRLLTNEAETCELRYVWRLEDSNLYDPELVSALAAQLAAELAPPLAALSGVVDRAEARAERALSGARISDGLDEEIVENPNESGWVSARYE